MEKSEESPPENRVMAKWDPRGSLREMSGQSYIYLSVDTFHNAYIHLNDWFGPSST